MGQLELNLKNTDWVAFELLKSFHSLSVSGLKSAPPFFGKAHVHPRSGIPSLACPPIH